MSWVLVFSMCFECSEIFQSSGIPYSGSKPHSTNYRKWNGGEWLKRRLYMKDMRNLIYFFRDEVKGQRRRWKLSPEFRAVLGYFHFNTTGFKKIIMTTNPERRWLYVTPGTCIFCPSFISLVMSSFIRLLSYLSDKHDSLLPKTCPTE